MGMTRAEYDAKVESRVKILRLIAEGDRIRDDMPRLSDDMARLIVMDSEEFRKLRKQVKD